MFLADVPAEIKPWSWTLLQQKLLEKLPGVQVCRASQEEEVPELISFLCSFSCCDAKAGSGPICGSGPESSSVWFCSSHEAPSSSSGSISWVLVEDGGEPAEPDDDPVLLLETREQNLKLLWDQNRCRAQPQRFCSSHINQQISGTLPHQNFNWIAPPTGNGSIRTRFWTEPSRAQQDGDAAPLAVCSHWKWV